VTEAEELVVVRVEHGDFHGLGLRTGRHRRLPEDGEKGVQRRRERSVAAVELEMVNDVAIGMSIVVMSPPAESSSGGRHRMGAAVGADA
jgi:hypothetical protein